MHRCVFAVIEKQVYVCVLTHFVKVISRRVLAQSSHLVFSRYTGGDYTPTARKRNALSRSSCFSRNMHNSPKYSTTSLSLVMNTKAIAKHTHTWRICNGTANNADSSIEQTLVYLRKTRVTRRKFDEHAQGYHDFIYYLGSYVFHFRFRSIYEYTRRRTPLKHSSSAVSHEKMIFTSSLC